MSDQDKNSPASIVEWLLEMPLAVLDDIGTTVKLTGETVMWAVRPPYRVSQIIRAMEFIGVQSMFIVGLTGIFSGMVLALQMVHGERPPIRVA